MLSWSVFDSDTAFQVALAATTGDKADGGDHGILAPVLSVYCEFAANLSTVDLLVVSHLVVCSFPAFVEVCFSNSIASAHS